VAEDGVLADSFLEPHPRYGTARGVEFPLGLVFIFLILVVTALLNLFTKVVATAGGVLCTTLFLALLLISEHCSERRRGARYEHLEQFNQQTADRVTREGLGLHKPFLKLDPACAAGTAAGRPLAGGQLARLPFAPRPLPGAAGGAPDRPAGSQRLSTQGAVDEPAGVRARECVLR
jgi:hypothetical protein